MPGKIFVFLSVLATFSGAPVQAARPNVLLIVSEDNGPELSCYGDPCARTPNLDQLARDGVRFQHAFVPYSVCSPSRACFLTGLYPHENGQVGLATHKFSLYQPDTPNIVTLLQREGYRCGLAGKLHVNPQSAFPFDFTAISHANFNREQGADDYIAAAREFWSHESEKPWFLSVNFPDAHLPFLRQVDGQPEHTQKGDDVKMLPWVGADSPRLRELMADYYNCISRLDNWTGRLLQALQESGFRDNTLVIYIGDHGAQFPRGKGTVYESALRIPMIVRWPQEATPGTVREELVSTLDILPTVLTAASAPMPSDLSGRALQPLLKSQPLEEWRKYLFGMTTGSFPGNCYVQHSVRDRRFKLISNPQHGTENLIARSYLNETHPFFVISGVTPAERLNVSPTTETAFRLWERPSRYELYDLESDPHEWRNLAEDPHYDEDRNRLIGVLNDFQSRTGDPFQNPNHLAAFIKEQHTNDDMKYRHQQNFRWSYVRDFHTWRQQIKKPETDAPSR